MSFRDKKIVVNTQQHPIGDINEFAYERFNESMTTVRKDNWNGYVALSEYGSRLFFQYDGYAFLESIDSYEQRHYWVGLSYWNKERPDTFFELDLDTFYDFINIYLSENLSKFTEELKIIEFGGQLLDRINQESTTAS